MEDFGCKVGVLIPIHCDIQGAIDVVRNIVNGAGTRCVNTRFHFVRKLCEEVILCIHQEGRENESNTMTKNLTSARFNKCSPILEASPMRHLSFQCNIDLDLFCVWRVLSNYLQHFFHEIQFFN